MLSLRELGAKGSKARINPRAPSCPAYAVAAGAGRDRQQGVPPTMRRLTWVAGGSAHLVPDSSELNNPKLKPSYLQCPLTRLAQG